MSNNFYLYKTWDRLEFPIDLSKKELADQLGCSRHMISDALEALDGKNKDVLGSCFRKLIYGRKAEVAPDKRLSGKRDTTTSAFYWEITELLKALIQAKTDNSRAKGDKLAEYTFFALADFLSKNSQLFADKSFVQTVMLNNRDIQNAMNLPFIGKLEIRLQAIKYIIEHNPTSGQLLSIYDKLDSLIMEWTYGKRIEYCESRKVTVDSVAELYDHLMKVRSSSYIARMDKEKVVPYEASSLSPPFIMFKVPETDEGQAIIDELRQHLSRGEKRIKDDIKKAELEDTYERFLLSRIDTHEKETASKIAEQYHMLETYVNSQEDSPEMIEAAIREDLYTFARSQFAELQNLEYIPFQYSTYSPSSLQDGFIKERIKNVQTKIIYEFHEPFRLLRIFYSLYQCSCYDDVSCSCMRNVLKSSVPFHQLVFQMTAALIQLGMDYPHLPLSQIDSSLPFEEYSFAFFAQIPKEKFLQRYKELVVPIFSKEPDILEPMLDKLITGQYHENVLSEAVAVSSILLWSCQMAMLDSITEWTKLLMDDYRHLAEFFQAFNQNNAQNSSV